MYAITGPAPLSPELVFHACQVTVVDPWSNVTDGVRLRYGKPEKNEIKEVLYIHILTHLHKLCANFFREMCQIDYS